MVLGQINKFLYLFILGKIGLEKVFCNVLDRKLPFSGLVLLFANVIVNGLYGAYRDKCFQFALLSSWNFSKGIGGCFWVKIIKFSFVCFSSRRSKNDIWPCFRVVTRPPRLYQSTNRHILFR